jgi:hypothetical protein
MENIYHFKLTGMNTGMKGSLHGRSLLAGFWEVQCSDVQLAFGA